MIRRHLGIALVALGFAVPTAAQKVHVDYDRTVDFERYRTFAWGPTLDASPNLNDTAPLAHAWIKNGMEYYLTTVGLVEDEDNPDLRVTYYADEREIVKFDTLHAGYHYGPGWYPSPFWGMGWGASSTTTTSYDKGSLVIDIWDVEQDRVVWRGVAVDTIKEQPEKMVKQIDRAIEKITRKFEKMYRAEK